MTTVEANGTRLGYEEYGAGRLTFAFVHGWACDRSSWAPQVADLSRDFRCISFDMRGRGESTATPPFDIETQADDIASALQALEVDRAILVGHSLGGLVCAVVNDRHPDLVLGLVTGDSPLRADLSANERLAAMVQEDGMQAAMPMIERFFNEDTPTAVRDDIVATMLATSPDVAAGSLSSSQRVTGRMEEIMKAADEKPFMALWSARPLGDIPWLRETCVFLRHEPLAGAGHFFQLEQPEITCALLRAFVDDVERDPRLAQSG